MVGFIITGHGNFASGLYSACKILIGERKNVEVVDYMDNEDIIQLDKKISLAVSNLYSKCDKIIIFSDIFEGSPFNRCMVRCIREEKRFYIITGVNLPILIDGMLEFELCNGYYERVISNMKEKFPNTFIEGISKLKDEMKQYEII